MGPLPITGKGKSYILTAVDYLSRWAEGRAVKQITAKDVAKFVYMRTFAASLGCHLSFYLIKAQAFELI